MVKYFNLDIEENIEEVKTKKTNSTGDITPNCSFSVTSNLIDQILFNDNFSQYFNINFQTYPNKRVSEKTKDKRVTIERKRYFRESK